ncbi:MAG: DUF305 domain-containing protein [Chloroflexota bacterium]
MSKKGLVLSLITIVALVGVWSIPQPARAQMGGGPMHQDLDQLSGDAFDRAFLMEMTMHHAMGVVMTQPVVANAAHPELKALGEQIIAAQTAEIAQMRGWMKDWYGSPMDDPTPGLMPRMPRGAMGPGMQQGGMMPGMQPGGMMPGMQPGGMMPGMGPGGMGPAAKPGGPPEAGEHRGMSMMGDLWTLPPNRLEAVFMSLMIPHHEGAIEMAKLIPDRAAHAELKTLGEAIIKSQTAENEQMTGWLASWYGL